MPRKRQIDPDFFEDEEIAILTPYARLFYIGTWCHAEDTGVLELKPNQLKVKIFPYESSVDMESILKELEGSGKLIEYSRGGKDCLFIKGFHKRQTIQHPSCSYLPLPPEPYFSLIPESIRRLNKFKDSCSTQIALKEPSHRVELSRVELSRVELVGERTLSKEEKQTLKTLFPGRTDEPALRNHLKNRGLNDLEIAETIETMFYQEAV